MADPSHYTVHGPHPVLGHPPGATFEADIPPGQEARLLARGSLTKAGGLHAMTREELDALAVEAGVENPESLPNKGVVIDAINQTEGN